MSSAGRSPSRAGEPAARRHDRPTVDLSGPVSVCIDRPLLALDRPFTYDLPEELRAGIGSLVQVRFHGKLVRGWVLGPTDDIPARMLPVARLASRVRFFDELLLELYRWMSERYVAPLASVIARSVPPRVAGEEVAGEGDAAVAPPPRLLRGDHAARPGLSDGYTNGPRLLDAVRDGSGTFLVRTAPGDDAGVVVECVEAALSAGRSAVVIVPEIEPLPVTVSAVVEAFGDVVACFFGGDKRSRYRMWLDIGAGRYRVVVGTRPAVFAPLRDLGVVVVAREHHALHREERSPYFHVREVAAARAGIEGAACVMASVMPSLEAQAMTHVDVVPATRRWPPVEVVKPGPEGRAPRLVRALREARRGFLYEPMRGYGVARVCRGCGRPATCSVCGGMLRSEEGTVRCAVCEAPGRCGGCGGSVFGIARGGAERVEEWARGVAQVPVRRLRGGRAARPPREAEVLVGGIDAVKDLGIEGLDLVGIVNADASLRRPGVSSRERALTAWAEVAAWVGPSGRVVVQTSQPNDHAVQALVTGRPDRFARTEGPALVAAGLPVGCPVFRVAGTTELERELEALPHLTLLASEVEGQTVCLVALDPADLGAFGAGARRLAERGIVTRVEAEPHL